MSQSQRPPRSSPLVCTCRPRELCATRPAIAACQTRDGEPDFFFDDSESSRSRSGNEGQQRRGRADSRAEGTDEDAQGFYRIAQIVQARYLAAEKGTVHHDDPAALVSAQLVDHLADRGSVDEELVP